MRAAAQFATNPFGFTPPPHTSLPGGPGGQAYLIPPCPRRAAPIVAGEDVIFTGTLEGKDIDVMGASLTSAEDGKGTSPVIFRRAHTPPHHHTAHPTKLIRPCSG